MYESNKKDNILHKFTGFSFRTEAHQVIHTDHPSCVSVSAVRTWDRKTDNGWRSTIESKETVLLMTEKFKPAGEDCVYKQCVKGMLISLLLECVCPPLSRTYHVCRSLGHTRDNLWSWTLDRYAGMDIPCCYTHLQESTHKLIRGQTGTNRIQNTLCVLIDSHKLNTVGKLVWFYETSSRRTKLGVEVAFRHLGHVVFMEKLALVSLLTQSSEPVLTHHRLLSTDVTERTHPPWEWKQNTRCNRLS